MAAWTYDTLKAAILSYIESDEENFVANIPVIVSNAEDHILKNAQLPDFRKNCTGSVTGGDQYLGIPADYLSPYSLAVNAPAEGGFNFMLFKEVNFVRQAYPDISIQGVPKYYATFSSTFFLVGPTPDTNYEVELHYFYKPESIVTAGTSWLGDNAESTLLYGCIVEAYRYTKGTVEKIQVADSRYKEGLAALKLLGEGRNATDSYRNG